MANLSEELVLEVTGLAHDGRGVARLKDDTTSQGMVVLISGALPGQQVQARVVRRRKSFLEAMAERELRPIPDAVSPICPHSQLCGGCPLQTLPYSRQLQYKRTLVLDALVRIGGMHHHAVDTLLDPLLPSPALTRYRNKMEFAFGGGSGNALILGLRRRNGLEVMPVPGCALMPPIALAMLEMARHLAADSGFAAYTPPPCRPGSARHNQDSHHTLSCLRKKPSLTGFWRFFILRRGLATDTRTPKWWAICLTSPASHKQRTLVREMGRALLSTFPQLAAFLHEERASTDTLAIGEQRILTLDTAGCSSPDAAQLLLPLNGHHFLLDATSFFQVNTAAAQSLAQTATHLLSSDSSGHGPSRLLDLYCGVGAPGLLSAESYSQLLGMELNPRAAKLASFNALSLGFHHCHYMAGDVAHLLSHPHFLPWPKATTPARKTDSVTPGEGCRTDVLLDPPRCGLDPQSLTAIQSMKPDRILYISCNPSTLARDAKSLCTTHDLTRVVAVDLFPHTPHVECVSLWTRRPSP